MPDWTYVPFRKPALGILGNEQRTRRVALGVITSVARLPGGDKIIRGFDYTHDHPASAVHIGDQTYASPIGVVVPDPNAATETAFASMGYGFACAKNDIPKAATVTDATTIADLVDQLDAGAPLLVANQAAIELGPATAQRVNEVLAQRANEAAGHAREKISWVRPWSWPAWVWALWLGIAMVCGGIGATIIAVGPVILGYDEDFLGVDIAQLREFNDNLIPFLQHDRITMAGAMVAIGFNDIGFALAMRRGWRWARAGFVVAGAVGFPTFFLFLGYRFFDPLHFAVAVGFFPLYLGGVFGRHQESTWRVPIHVDERVRHRALFGQLMMVGLSVAVIFSGFVIMVIGLRDVLIPSDRVFLGADQATFEAALDGRLLRFIAHDRAAFGGTLASLGAGVLATTLWGWRAGERTTWLLLGAASIVGFGAALAVHWEVGYTDFLHLLPVYLGIGWTAGALWLSREWFTTSV